VTDADGDGYDAEHFGGEDCDDEDPAVNPDATETWYDGVDQDCSGGSDYDQDGDGADAVAWGGVDCDDTDPEVQEDCPPDDSPLASYSLATGVETVKEIGSNLSGIAWSPASGTWMGVLDHGVLVELDAELGLMREIELDNMAYRDTEGIAYLGMDPKGSSVWAIVTESGAVYIGAVPSGDATAVDLEGWQTLVYAADDMGNSGGEGIAYDAPSSTIWVFKEQDPMVVYAIRRPRSDADASYEDGGLEVAIAFDAEHALAEHAGDLAGATFDERTGRLLILSERTDTVLDVAADGTVFGTLDLSDAGLSKPEGIALTADGDLLVVGEPNQWALYGYVAP